MLYEGGRENLATLLEEAKVTAVHLVEGVLPRVPYRQWTLSSPHRVRGVLLKTAGSP